MTTPKQLSDFNPDGTTLGQSTTDKVSLYGVTPIVQRSGGTQAKVSTTAIAAVTATVTVQGTTWGFTSSAMATTLVDTVNQLITQSAANMVLVNELRASLVALGAIAGA